MRPRSPDEAHRAATPLELFFDLVFVVAVAQAGSRLHHGLAEAHGLEAFISYAMVFFAIWWAWMNFTWFASAYDTDDVPYRLAVFVQLTGALILAAGVPAAFDEHNFTIATIGYVVLRLPLVAQWLRAARSDPARRSTAYRFAIGVTACQTGWVVLLFFPTAWFGFPLLALAELLVPIWAERQGPTLWHPEHITERYGLFTIIVLGETILSASLAIQSATQAGDFNADLAAIIVGGLLIVFSMWWLYFDQPGHTMLSSLRTAFVWGYSHLFIFAAAAAVGAGLSVAVDQTFHHAEIDAVGAGAAVAVPVVIYLTGLWALHQQPRTRSFSYPVLFPLMALLILLPPLSGQAVLLTGLLLTTLVVIKVASRYRTGAHAAP
ncbi:MAG: low temperature requirement protein A [Chloroflexi bacterium]|nr:low temperature requirement protein A [Chloroflexota bacterium]